MGLALNRYIGNSILPALISHSSFYAEADQHAPLLDATLHTVYRLSKCKVCGSPPELKRCNWPVSGDVLITLIYKDTVLTYRLCETFPLLCQILTKGQREAVSDFLVALTREMQPAALLPLLRKLTIDVSKLSEYTTVALRVCTLHVLVDVLCLAQGFACHSLF